MAMTKSRRADGAARKAAQSPVSLARSIAQAGTFAEVVEVLGSTDVERVIIRDRKSLSRTFADMCDIHSGEKGNAKVAYSQKIHWALLDVIALQETKINTALHAIFVLAEALTGMEKTSKQRTKSLNHGFSLEDLEVEQIDDRNVKIGVARGDQEASFTLKFPVLIGRGIWSAEEDYDRGDVTQWGGSAWEAVEPEKGVKPDLSSGGWRILAKRGRDGKSRRDAQT